MRFLSRRKEIYIPGDWGFWKIWGFIPWMGDFYPRGLEIFENLGIFIPGFSGMAIFRGWDFISWDGIPHQKATSGQSNIIIQSNNYKVILYFKRRICAIHIAIEIGKDFHIYNSD